MLLVDRDDNGPGPGLFMAGYAVYSTSVERRCRHGRAAFKGGGVGRSRSRAAGAVDSRVACAVGRRLEVAVAQERGCLGVVSPRF